MNLVLRVARVDTCRVFEHWRNALPTRRGSCPCPSAASTLPPKRALPSLAPPIRLFVHLSCKCRWRSFDPPPLLALCVGSPAASGRGSWITWKTSRSNSRSCSTSSALSCSSSLHAHVSRYVVYPCVVGKTGGLCPHCPPLSSLGVSEVAHLI